MSPAAWRPFALVAVSLAAVVATPFAWRDPPARVETLEVVPADTDAGRQLFRVKGCAVCHEGPDVGSDSGLPDLSDAPAWAGDRLPGYSAAEYLAESMRRPGAFEAVEYSGPGTEMPTLGLSDEEIDALVAYLLAP